MVRILFLWAVKEKQRNRIPYQYYASEICFFLTLCDPYNWFLSSFGIADIGVNSEWIIIMTTVGIELCENRFVCPVLVFGGLLLIADSIIDANYVLSRNQKAISRYYTYMLCPKLYPLPWPGFLGMATFIMPLLTKCLQSDTSKWMYAPQENIFYSCVISHPTNHFLSRLSK